MNSYAPWKAAEWEGKWTVLFEDGGLKYPALGALIGPWFSSEKDAEEAVKLANLVTSHGRNYGKYELREAFKRLMGT